MKMMNNNDIDWKRFSDFYDSKMSPLENAVYDHLGDDLFLLVGRLWDGQKLKLEVGMLDQDDFEHQWKNNADIFYKLIEQKINGK